MFKFKINTENCKKFESICGGISNTLLDKAKAIFVVDNDKLNFYLSSSETINFKTCVDIYDTVNDEQNNYFLIDSKDFIRKLSAVSEGYSNDVLVTIEAINNKIIFKNETTGTVISLSNFESETTKEEVDESEKFIESKLESDFASGAHDITINAGIVSFINTMDKFMQSTKHTNAVVLNQNKIKYADTLIVVEKTLPETASAEDTDICLNKALIDFVEPYIKICTPSVKISKDFQKAYVKTPNVEAILSFSTPTYEYPTAEEIEGVASVDTDHVALDVDKSTLLNAFSKFDDVFKVSNWDWKSINFNASPKCLNDGKIKIYHEDYSGTVETYLPVTVVENNENAANFTDSTTNKEIEKNVDFIFSLMAVSYLMNIVPEQKISFTFNRLPSDAPHGTGITIKTDTVNAMVCKIYDDSSSNG